MTGSILTPAPSIREIVGNAGVYRDGWEWFGYTLYDTIVYPAAGQLSFDFFANVQGKTRANTNLELNGQLPMNKAFLVQAIEIAYFSGTAPSVGGLAGGVANDAVNEAYKVLGNGSAQLKLGDKEYATIAPLLDAPSQTRFRLDGFGTDQTTPAATLQANSAIMQADGRQFKLAKPVLIPNNSTFGVNVQYDAKQTVTVDGRMMVRLRGMLIRKSQ